MFTGLEGFSSHAPNDVQDGDRDRLMISELLDTDFTDCFSVPDGINTVHDEIGLHNGTVCIDASFKLI